MNMKTKTTIPKVKLILAFLLLLSFESWSQTYPTISITSPANNSTYTAPATITFNATAAVTGGTITQVEFFEGPNSIGVDNTAPFSFVWSNVAAGTYLITARATSDAGFRTNSTVISVVVNPGTG